MRIDFHQHFFAQAPCYSNEHVQDWLHHDSRVQGYANTEQVLQALDDADIDIAVFQGEYLLHHENCVARNHHIQTVCAAAPDRFRAFAMIQPRHPAACDEIARCMDAGMWGVGELNPAGQQFSIRDRAVQRVLEYCALHAIPMLFHVNEPVGRDYPGKSPVGLPVFYEIAARYPELRLILAHWGGGLLWYETMPAVRAVLKNVYYDTAASPLLFPDTETMVQMALLTAPHKIIFGSDFPLRLNLRQPAAIAPFANQLWQALPNPTIRDAWFGGNAMALLHSTHQSLPQPAIDALVVDAQTSIVALVARYPQMLGILASFGVHVDEHTPWWQTLRSAATMIGMSPHDIQELIGAIREAVGD